MKKEKAINQLNQLKRLVRKNKVRLAAEWPKNQKWKILISTILSAQSRDEKTISESIKLYKKYPSLSALSKAKLSDIKKILKQMNYYKTKSKHILQTAKIIVKRKSIPNNLSDLLKLPGVGRKVGNVYLAVAHNADCIGVDTHVARISRKLGWTENKNPHRIEKDLEALFPKKYWRSIN